MVAVGTAEQIMNNTESLTGQYLSGAKEIKIPANGAKPTKSARSACSGRQEIICRICQLNFPLGVLTCVTGVSGSGKSTLVLETLWKALSRQLHKAREIPAPYDKLTGMDLLDKVVDIDQSPIGRTPRSNPATYTGAFTPIREWFAGLPESKAAAIPPAGSASM